jgi:hypothetical protein
MPLARTSAEIITKALQLSDQEQYGTGPGLIGTAESLDRANDSLTNFWEFLTRNAADELLAQRVTLTGPGAEQNAPDFPTDFYKLLRFEVLDGGRYIQIHRLPDEQQTDWHEAPADTGTPRYYLIRGARQNPIAPRLYPDPGSGARTYRLEYVPEAPRFSTGESGLLSIELPNGWWRWIEYDLAIGFMDKEESDSSALHAKRDEIGASVLSSMTDSDYSEPRRVQDRRGLLGRMPLPDYLRRDFRRGW